MLNLTHYLLRIKRYFCSYLTCLHFQIPSLKIITNLELPFDGGRMEDVFTGSIAAAAADGAIAAEEDMGGNDE